MNLTTVVGLLDLSHNRFVQVPSSITGASHVIVDLRLDFNNISSLSNWTGPGAQHCSSAVQRVRRSDVERLSVRGNDIGELTMDFVAAVRPSLVQLDLRDNRLTTLDQPLFDNITYLRHLMLKGNPLHCDCQLAWLRQLALRVTVDSVTCRSPVDVVGELAICYNISSCANVTDELLSIVDVRCLEDHELPPTTAATTTTGTEPVTSSSPEEPTTPGDRGSSFSHVGFVIGLVLAALLVIVIVVIVWWACRRFRHRDDRLTAGENSMTEYTTPYSTMNTMTTVWDDEHDSKA